jgi:GDPmannose 4,6-dehydratase
MAWMILQAKEAEDWGVKTIAADTVRWFVRVSFSEVGIELECKGEDIDEKAYVFICNNPACRLERKKEVLAVDSKYFRSTEVDLLIGDSTKAQQKYRVGVVMIYKI